MTKKEVINTLYKIVNLWEDEVEYSNLKDNLYATCWNMDTLMARLRDDLESEVE